MTGVHGSRLRCIPGRRRKGQHQERRRESQLPGTTEILNSAAFGRNSPRCEASKFSSDVSSEFSAAKGCKFPRSYNCFSIASPSLHATAFVAVSQTVHPFRNSPSTSFSDDTLTVSIGYSSLGLLLLITAFLKPSLEASFSLIMVLPAGLTSPASPTSPMKQTSEGSGMSFKVEASETHTARSRCGIPERQTARDI